ncbi:MAG: hypothetical protein FJ276_15695 [Planctomycetes bacterium]|nr:hypothetical protein [Planctomycetota bacterium]
MNEHEAPTRGRRFPGKRAVNIALRTAHIGVSGVLLGGHVFAVGADRLTPWLVAVVITGVLLTCVEAYPRACWFYQGRGLFVLAKLGLICLVPWFWSYRVAILSAVVVLASVGSHMPARYRYFSVLHGRVLD